MSAITATDPRTSAQAATTALHGATREYLSFKLGAEEYGIDFCRQSSSAANLVLCGI